MSLLREDWNVIWFSFAHSPSFTFCRDIRSSLLMRSSQQTEALAAIKSGTALVAFQRTEYCSCRNHQVSHFVQHKGCLCYRTWAPRFETSSSISFLGVIKQEWFLQCSLIESEYPAFRNDYIEFYNQNVYVGFFYHLTKMKTIYELIKDIDMISFFSWG